MTKPSEDSLQPNGVELADFEFICFNLTRELMSFDEPIPDYSTRNNNLLESSLAVSRQTFDKKLIYPDLRSQATALFYSLIKNHPFLNGNKRIAVITLLVFLSLNGKWLEISPKLLYEIAVSVAESKAKDKEKTIGEINKIFKKHLVTAKNI